MMELANPAGEKMIIGETMAQTWISALSPWWNPCFAGVAGMALALSLGCAGQQTSRPLRAQGVELRLDPASLRVAPGTTGHFTATLQALDGFSGTVQLTADASGSDLSAQVSPSTLTLNGATATASITVQVPTRASTGDRVFALHARGSFEPQDLPFTVSVPAAQVLPVSTYVNFIPANLPFMVFKDGDAPWRLLDGSGGVYEAAVTDPAGRYGLAYGYNCAIGAFHSFQMNYIFQTLPESNALGVYFMCDPPPGPDPVLYSLQGRIQGQGASSGYLVTSAATLPFESGASSYLTRVLKGKGDLAGWLFSNPGNHIPTRFFLDRGRDAQGDAVRDVDFFNDGFDPGPSQPVTYGPVGSDETLQGIVRYFTAGGQYFGLGDGLALNSYASFPAERSDPGDSYGYGFGAFAQDHGEAVYGGGQGLPGPLSISFPTPVQPFQVDWLPGPYRRPGLTWSSVNPLPTLQQFALTQNINQEQVYWYLLFSEGWLGAGVHQVQIPDFTGFTGWDDAWGFRPDKAVNVDHGQFGSIGGGAPNAAGTEKASAMVFSRLSDSAGLLKLQAPGQQHGAFRVVGLAGTQSANSYSAQRRMVTTP